MSLALKYLVEKRGMSGAVVRTVSTTRMIDRSAKEYGLKSLETPVGFNHIAEHMMNEDVLIGGEESGGISFKGHIPEGDGNLMSLVLVEMVSILQKCIYELVEELMEDVGVEYKRKDIQISRPVSKPSMTHFLTSEAPKEIGDEEKIIEMNTTDGVGL